MDEAAVTDGAVHGAVVDDQTRCVHYAGPTDVVAIRFRCCLRWYPCAACHEAEADHPAVVWPVGEWRSPAVLCGVCRAELTVTEYLGTDPEAPCCPRCGAAFNPGCARHHHLYFATAGACPRRD